MRGAVNITLVLFLVLFTAFCLVKCFAAQETVTITTYYPSPFGFYRELNITGRVFMSNLSDAGTWGNALVFTGLSNTGDNSSIKLVNRGGGVSDGARSELRIETWNSKEDRIYIGGAQGFGNLAEGYAAGGLIVNAGGNSTLTGVLLMHGLNDERGCIKLTYGSMTGQTHCPPVANIRKNFTVAEGVPSASGGYFWCCNY